MWCMRNRESKIENRKWWGGLVGAEVGWGEGLSRSRLGAERDEVGFYVAGFAADYRFKAEVEDFVEFVKGDADVKAGFGGLQPGATGLLHDGISARRP